MSLEKRLLEILCCPETKQPVGLLDAKQIEVLNRAQSAGTLKHADGSPVTAKLSAGLLTTDGKRVYVIDDGIPVMLIDQAIPTAQVTDFEVRG